MSSAARGVRPPADPRGPRGSMRRGGFGLGALLAGLLLTSGALEAQQAGGPRGGGAGERVRADTLSADTARARVLERLRRLSAQPAPDTLADSLRAGIADTAAAGPRPGAPGTQRPAPRAQGARAGGPPADSVMAELMRLPGYTVSRYRGDRAGFNGGERVLDLYGNADAPARFFRDDVGELTADSAISYDERAGRVRTVGRNVFQSPGSEPVASRILIYDLNESRATALGAETRYAERGSEWFVRGDLTSVEEGRVWGSHARFTSCELEVPHSHFETDRIKIVQGNVLVARSVTMYFADVPVFWLPFMAQSLGEDRGSGLLTPRFSVNDIVRTSTGYNRRVSNIGFYWAMSDYSDAIVSFDWWSNNYKAVTGDIRYNWLRQFLRGDLSVSNFWQDEGGTQLTLNTRNNWEIDERTRLNVTGRYASSSAFVRRNTFDPLEAVQSITSTAGFSRRFDWGTLSIDGNRNQYLSDDRVETTLPNVGLSLSPITLFRAAPSEAGPFSNITWQGRAGFTRNTVRRETEPGAAFSFGAADLTGTRASASSSFSIGNLSWSQEGRFDENVRPNVPDSIFLPGVLPPVEADPDAGVRDLSVSSASWSSSLSYRQRLIGTTTLTPRVSLSGQLARSDTIPEASSFVSAPMRVSFGAELQTDIFGFYPGIGAFSAIRHKMTPSFSYSYTPRTEPTNLQRIVFGSQELQPRSQVVVGFNQTWEAKIPAERAREGARGGEAAGEAAGEGARQAGRAPGEEEARPGEEPAPGTGEPGRGEEEDTTGARGDMPGTAEEAAQTPQEAEGDGPRRLQQDRIVNLLSLRTSSVTYDFVRADTLGFFTGGFTTTQITNQVSSDYLRGLNLSVQHDIFSDVREGGEVVSRSFSPHLSQLNLSFSIGSRTALFQRLFGERDAPADEPEDEEDDEFFDEEDPFGTRGGIDDSSVIPRRGERTSPRRSTPLGEWSADLSYSLRRPRPLPGQDEADRRRLNAQMLQAYVSFKPTENWDVRWRTSYDLERGTFNDHMISLRRDLHEWEASFDFRQTATGNWSFRFEVSLIANRDLKFDFEQRNLDGQPPRF